MGINLKAALVGVGQRGLDHVECLSLLQADEELRLAALVDPFLANLSECKIQASAPSYKQEETELFGDVVLPLCAVTLIPIVASAIVRFHLCGDVSVASVIALASELNFSRC